jgi:acyl dehydratase
VLRRKFEQSRYFEDFTLGETFYIPSRTIGDAEVAAFRAASGDNHPLHYDMEYAKERGFPSILVHPLQMLLYTTPGASVHDVGHEQGRLLHGHGVISPG